jgi:hypothetical protein
VRAAWEEEQPRLLALPQNRFETDLVMPISSGKQPYIRFDGNEYSIPHGLIQEPLTLVASDATVRILEGSREVARHERSWDRKQVIENVEHIAALARVKRAAHELRGRDLLRTVCKSADKLLSAIAERGENLGGHTQRLLGLLDRYGARELDRAVQDVLTRGAYSADAVAHVLDQRARKRKQPPPLQTLLPDDPRIRDMRIPQHSLTEYDALGDATDENETR